MKLAISIDKKKQVTELKNVAGLIICEIENKQVKKKKHVELKKAGDNFANICKLIKDCKIIIVSKIEKSLYEKLICKNIIPVECEEKDIDRAIKIFLASNLANE